MSDILNALMRIGQQQEDPQLTYRNMMDYVQRDPQMREQFMSSLGSRQVPQDANMRTNQILGEAAGVADPFAFSALQRLMGQAIPDQAWLNESHGLARREQHRYK